MADAVPAAAEPPPEEREVDGASDQEGADASTSTPEQLAAKALANKKKRDKKKAQAARKKAEAAAGTESGAGGAAFVCGVPSKVPLQRGVRGFCDSYVACGQTDPPTLPVAALFKGRPFPAGEEGPHAGECNTFRETSEEKRHLDRLNSDVLESLREAAEVHRHVRPCRAAVLSSARLHPLLTPSHCRCASTRSRSSARA